MAVNETSGDVYVVDRANNRVERFDSTGTFLSTWGYGVTDGKKETQVCTSACKAGIAPGKAPPLTGKGQLDLPEGIAIDNSKTGPSAGDVYVVADVIPEHSSVLKYSATGELLGRVNKVLESEEFGRVEGVSVDTKGVVWISWSFGYLTNYTNDEPNKRVNKEEEIEMEVEEAVRPALAVDSQGSAYVSYEPEEKFEESEEEDGQGKGGQEPCEKATCIVAKIATHELTFKGEEYFPGEFLKRALDGENTHGLATKSSNDDLYVNNGTGLSTFTSSGALVQRFGVGALTRGSGIAVNATSDTVYAADAGADRVDVFTPEPAGKPAVEELSAEKISSDSAVLNATIDPRGSETTYTFQYATAGPIVCEATPNPACEAPIPAVSLGSGFGDRPASLHLSGLAPGTTYHYRVLAIGKTFGTATSEERTFTTQPTSAGFALPDNRAWELVSPPEKNGVAFEALSREGGQIVAAADGSGIAYIALGPSEANPEGNRAPEFAQILSNRVNGSDGKEWASKDITTPNQFGLGVFPGIAPEYQWFSSDLSEAILNPLGGSAQAEPPLSEDATEKTIYRRHNEGCAPAPSSCYTPLVTAANVTSGKPFGGETLITGKFEEGLTIEGATPDANHVVLSSRAQLTTTTTTLPTDNLYEWTAGAPAATQLQLVSVLPEGTPVAANLGNFTGNMVRHAISDDGSRVIWSAERHLYMRDTVAQTTTKIDVPEVEPEPGTQEFARFQTASSDGSKVFFTDQQRLTKDSTANPEQGNRERRDLYEWDLATGKLTDLTVDHNAGESAAVQDLIVGASDDGTAVSFVANGALTSVANAHGEKAVSGHCASEPLPAAKCNLYAEHYNGATKEWEAPKLIAVLSQDDEHDWEAEGGSNEDLARITSRISPNGRYVTFMSDQRLTGYDNRDANPASEGAPDEEVFLYDSDTGSLTCASCNPTGARPTGVLDEEESGEGLGLQVDRIENWNNGNGQGRWLAANIPGWTSTSGHSALYQSRYLQDSGRLYFNAADSLVPRDINGKNDVYQYEPNGVGNCHTAAGCVSLISSGTSTKESSFLDASESGDDVFFLTSSALVDTDIDNNFDVYDARVCEPEACIATHGGSSPACSTLDSCKGPAGTAPGFAAPASATPSGSGNSAQNGVSPVKTAKPVVKKPTRAQQLSKALKACKKLRKKQKRLACEKSARKKYGPKKASKQAHKSAHKRSRAGSR